MTLLLVAAALALLVVAAARPALACALLAVAIPLTAGLGRGTVVPVLRVNEALLLVVVAGVALGRLPRRRALPFTGLDLAVLAFCLGSVLIPWAVILLTGADADRQDWLTVFGPVQYLVVYLLYSRTEFSAAGRRWFLNALMIASVPVALVAVAQAVDLGGVRTLIDAYYPTQPLPSWDTVYRPASLLGFYSAVGAFGLLNFLLALALAATRHPGFAQPWLAVVMGVNVVALLASATYAPLLALPAGAAAVLLVARRVPWRQLLWGLPALAVAGVFLWPQIAGRIDQQLGGGGSGLRLPETLATRVTYWQGFFVPALLKHGLWLGTGTLMPSEVPRPLVDFVDNGYLWQWFRAGLPGLALQALLLAALVGTAWACRRSGDPARRALGATCLGAVASMVLVDTTSEYLTFTAVGQEFWMLAGALAGSVLTARPAAAFVEIGRAARGWWERPAALLRRLAPDPALVRAAVVVVGGFGVARVLGFAFQVAAGRVLAPADYGRLTYALAVAAVLSVLVTTAPLGLSRALARHAGDPAEQRSWHASWLAAVGLVLAASLTVTAAAGWPLGLGGWLLPGLLANVLGVAALETYREVQRGLGRYTLQAVYYVLANALQLAAALALSAAGLRSPALLLAVYGLSSVAALAAVAPFGPGLPLAAVRWDRVREVLRFLRPVLLQSVLWNLWFGGDLILVEHLRSAADTGAYGAAKAIANGFEIAPAAVAFVLVPRVARLAETEVRGQVLRALALTAAALAPAVAVVAAAAGPLTALLFGPGYAAAAPPLVVLAAGMAAVGLKSVLDALWLGLGHPVVDAVATAAAAAVTLVAGLLLIPAGGPAGAAAAFSAGAAAQLAVMGAVTAWAFGGAVPRVRQRADGPARGPGRWAPLWMRARRSVAARRGWLRRLAWGDRVAYEARPHAGVAVEPAPDPPHPGPPPPAGRDLSDVVGLLDGRTAGVVAVLAGLLGLGVETTDGRGRARVIDRAVAERWRLLHACPDDLSGLTAAAGRALATFVQTGGTLYVDGLGPGSGLRLEELCGWLGVRAPWVMPAADARSLVFAADQVALVRELAGARLRAGCAWPTLVPAAGWRAVASAETARGPLPVVLRHGLGRGAIVLSTGPAALRSRLAGALTAGSARAAAAVVPLLVLRGVYGAAAWHAPAVLANCSIDDPALRRGRFELAWDALLERARERGFHATVATIPRELPVADPAVVDLLRRHPAHLSACYHGCDHDGYEFYAPAAARTRYPARPLAGQREALRRAVAHGRRFTEATGGRLDRVMVFPHGVGPAEILPELHRLGFIGSANFGDKYPPGGPVPDDADLGLRPADVAWSGFPLLWRRALDDEGFAIDVLLGRPALVFAHVGDLGRDFAPLVECAAAIDRAAGGAATWRGLEEVARHAYLQRRGPDGWEALMTANEACLHNPDPAPRRVAVRRPHRPAGSGFEVDGRRVPGEPSVVVPAGGTAVVRLVAGEGPPALAGGGRCSIFATVRRTRN